MIEHDVGRVHRDEDRRGRSDAGRLRRRHDRFFLSTVVGGPRRKRET